MRRTFIVFISSIFLGFIPGLLFFSSGAEKGLTNYLKLIMPPDSLVWYACGLFAIHFVIAFLGKWKNEVVAGVRERFQLYYAIGRNIGMGLSCLYQVISGAVLACAVIATWHYQEVNTVILVSFWFWWFMFFMGAYYSDKGYEYAVEMQKK